MGVGSTLTSIASRLFDPVERIEGSAEFTVLEDAIERQALQIRALHAQLDLIERQTGRKPPEAE